MFLINKFQLTGQHTITTKHLYELIHTYIYTYIYTLNSNLHVCDHEGVLTLQMIKI